jgi:hypothetical protein
MALKNHQKRKKEIFLLRKTAEYHSTLAKQVLNTLKPKADQPDLWIFPHSKGFTHQRQKKTVSPARQSED